MVTPAAMVDEVFRWLHDKEAVDAPYLQASRDEVGLLGLAPGLQGKRKLPERNIVAAITD